jgi:tRNA threonylcarbamoyladenosine modification (KEOPS) complex Cgi121 subunit
MLKYIEGSGKYAEITGYRNIRINDCTKFLEIAQKDLPQSVWIQFFDARFVATWEHLFFASINAITAFRNKYNISKSLAMEVMLYASAQRQIRRAITLLGVKQTSANVAVIIISEKPDSVEMALSIISKNLGVEADETVLVINKEKMACIRDLFDITGEELEAGLEKGDVERALVNLVIERMALLTTRL